jgi:hypothetical protein
MLTLIILIYFMNIFVIVGSVWIWQYKNIYSFIKRYETAAVWLIWTSNSFFQN